MEERGMGGRWRNDRWRARRAAEMKDEGRRGRDGADGEIREVEGKEEDGVIEGNRRKYFL